MQTNMLPAATCEHIDKLNMNFLWCDSLERKKIHLINWDQICKPLKERGLGIQDTKTNNLSNLSKVGWKLIENDNWLWAKVLNAKYTQVPQDLGVD